MSKIIINSRISSKNENETLNGIKAVKKDGKISYIKDNIKVNIIILDNKVYLERENKDMKINLEFEEDKSLITKYLVKDLNLNIKLETKTKELIIKKDSIKIMYDLFMNDDFSDSFTYDLEWSDMK